MGEAAGRHQRLESQFQGLNVVPRGALTCAVTDRIGRVHCQPYREKLSWSPLAANVTPSHNGCAHCHAVDGSFSKVFLLT